MQYRILILTYFIIFNLTHLFGQPPTWSFGKSFDGSLTDLALDICTDQNNNIILVGSFYSPDLEFGPFTLSTNGIDDIFVSKFDNSGNVIWAKSFGGNGYDAVMAVANDDSGNIYITGSFDSDSIQFDGLKLFKTGITNLFLVKLDENGNVLLAKQSYNSITCGAQGLTINHSGDLFLTAEAGDSLVLFDQDSIHITQVPGGVVSLLFKLNRNGNLIWRKVIEGPGRNDYPLISSDGLGNSFLFFHSGTHSVTIDTTLLLNNVNSYDNVYIVKFDSSGNFVFAALIAGLGGLGAINNKEIAADSIGNYYVVGSSEADTLDFGQFQLTKLHSNYDAFLAKYNNLGIPIWAKFFGGNSYDAALNVAINADGGPTFAGYFYSSSITIDTISLINDSTSYTDIFYARFDSSGNINYATDFGGAKTEYTSSIVIDKNGVNYLAGQTNSDMVLFNNLTLSNNTGTYDIFLLKSDLPTEIKSTPNDVVDGKFITFPNPGKGKFQIICNLPIQRISVTNLFGQIVFSDDISTNNHQQYSFDLYHPGIYILSVQVSTGLMCRKIVVE